ncbi:MAG: hypothetical protein LBG50_02615 [Clostridiales Family XIII bacterium]|nr:hypothetical protein [Clostridiales Family XIII bacterium]
MANSVRNHHGDGGHEGHTHGGCRHTHDHGAAHGHDDQHGEDGGVGAGGGEPGKDKLIAVLSYMKDHNHEHARELTGLLEAARKAGSDEAADIIAKSAEAIDSAADGIEKAVELLSKA